MGVCASMDTVKQPMPIKSKKSEVVIDSLLPKITKENVKELLLKRNELGKINYGVELVSHNGRDNLLDFCEEIADALMYLEAIQLEQGESTLYKNTLYVLETVLSKFLQKM